MPDRHTDAAAVPVPDAGDDTRNISREEADFNRAAQEAAEQTGVSLDEVKRSLLRLGDAVMGDEHAGDDTLRRAIATTIGNHTVPIKATLPNGEQAWPASIHILIGESEEVELICRECDIHVHAEGENIRGLRQLLGRWHVERHEALEVGP